MNIWMITSIAMETAGAPRASSIQNARTAAALAGLGHRVLLWHTPGNAAQWYRKNFGAEPPEGLFFIGYEPRGEKLEKKTPFFGATQRVTNLTRGWMSPVGAPELILTRSPLVLEQLREGWPALPFMGRARLVLEWQYPESAQLWRGWRRRAKGAPLKEAVYRLRKWRREETARVAYADGILYAARDHERLIKAAGYQGPAEFFPSGCVAPAAPPDAPAERRVEFEFGYIGGIAPENGVETAIEALARVEAGRMLLLGPGEQAYVEKLKRRAEELGLKERVEFGGRVEPALVRGQMRRCGIGLAPISRRCGREKRQFASPLKLIEWMAAGVPAIASDVPSVTGLAKNGVEAAIVKADDPAALSQAMKRLTGDEGLREKIARNGLKMAEGLEYAKRAEIVARLAERMHGPTRTSTD